MSKLLEILAKKHLDWIKMARSLANHMSMDDANELVQDMYVKMDRYSDDYKSIMFNDTDINTMYIYLTIRSLYIDRHRYLTRYPQVESMEQLTEHEQLPCNEIDITIELSQLSLEDKIKEEIKTWHHYDRKVFNIIFMDQVSMRKLARETKISLPSIFNTIKSKKQILKEKFIEDYKKHKKL